MANLGSGTVCIDPTNDISTRDVCFPMVSYNHCMRWLSAPESETTTGYSQSMLLTEGTKSHS